MKKRNLYTDLGIAETKSSIPFVDTAVIKEQVKSGISSASCERKVSYMKSKKKLVVLAAAAIMLLGVTVYAASGMILTWYSSSSPADELKSLPSTEECVKEIGYAPVLVDSFQTAIPLTAQALKRML